jgi:hypothetical protein
MCECERCFWNLERLPAHFSRSRINLPTGQEGTWSSAFSLLMISPL